MLWVTFSLAFFAMAKTVFFCQSHGQSAFSGFFTLPVHEPILACYLVCPINALAGSAALLLAPREILCCPCQSCKAPGTPGSSSAGCGDTVVDGRMDGGEHVQVAAGSLGSLGSCLHEYFLIFQCE